MRASTHSTISVSQFCNISKICKSKSFAYWGPQKHPSPNFSWLSSNFEWALAWDYGRHCKYFFFFFFRKLRLNPASLYEYIQPFVLNHLLQNKLQCGTVSKTLLLRKICDDITYWTITRLSVKTFWGIVLMSFVLPKQQVLICIFFPKCLDKL